MKQVLFICTGNTCRSPMAQYLFAEVIEQKGLCAHASSAGTNAADGMPASEGAVKVLAEIDIDLTAFRSRRVTKEMLDNADIIVAIGRHNAQLLKSYGYTVCEFDISDPYLCDIGVYRRCREQIKACLKEVEKLI